MSYLYYPLQGLAPTFGATADTTSLSIQDQGKLVAALGAAQVTSATGVLTTPEDIITRVRALLPVTTAYGSGGIFGSGGARQVFETAATEQDAWAFLAGVYTEPSAAVKDSLGGPNWLQKIMQVASIITALGLDKPIVAMLKQGIDKISDLIGGVEDLSQVTAAIPYVTTFLQFGMEAGMYLAKKWAFSYPPSGLPMTFAVEPVACYAAARGEPLSNYPDPSKQNNFPGYTYNLFFDEVFALRTDFSPPMPRRALDLEDYRKTLASPAMQAIIRNGPNSAMSAQGRPFSNVKTCRTSGGSQVMQNMDIMPTDRGARGAIVAAAYLFGNTACVCNIGKWSPNLMYPNRKDALDKNNYRDSALYYYLGGGIPTKTTGWYSMTDGEGKVYVHPPIPFKAVDIKAGRASTGQVREARTVYTMDRATVTTTLAKGADWYLLGTEPDAGQPKPSAVAAATATTSQDPATGKPAIKVTVSKPQQQKQAIYKPTAKFMLPVISYKGSFVPKKVGLSIAAKVGIGIGATALVGTGGYLAYRKLKKH